jgi:hypothetical protein
MLFLIFYLFHNSLMRMKFPSDHNLKIEDQNCTITIFATLKARENEGKSREPPYYKMKNNI